MAVIFPRWTNRLPLMLLGFVAAGGAFATFGVWYWFSPEFTDVGYAPVQPVAFSHKLHAGELGMDCRYCHSTVEKAAHAAVPPTAVCMGCHTQVLPKSPKLELVRQSYQTGKPIPWVRVHMLPDYSFFDHSVHVAAGVGCASCHGRIDKMTRVYQHQPLSMGWCLDCHRDPNKHLRPSNKVTQMDWEGSTQQVAYNPAKDPSRARRKDIAAHRDLMKKGHTIRVAKNPHGVVVNPPEHCSGCHR